MKTLKIYTRKVTERTGFRKYPYKEVTQVTIIYDNKEVYNHYENINNPRLKIKFKEVLNTRSIKKAKAFIDGLGKTNADKWIKQEINKILVMVENENNI